MKRLLNSQAYLSSSIVSVIIFKIIKNGNLTNLNNLNNKKQNFCQVDEEIKNLYQQIVGSVDEYEWEKGLKFFQTGSNVFKIWNTFKDETQMLKCFQDLKYSKDEFQT